jgi:7-cyano-7-deazaguanine synthase
MSSWGHVGGLGAKWARWHTRFAPVCTYLLHTIATAHQITVRIVRLARQRQNGSVGCQGGLGLCTNINKNRKMTLHLKPAVVLLSGGLDSATTLAIARRDGYRCHALSFDYGQRHAIELESARRVAKALEAVQHKVMALDLRALGGSALTSDQWEVPRDRSGAEMAAGIPITYVPARNTVFLALALAYAEVLGSFDIFVGVNAIDYSGYPDCRPEFIGAFEELANLATRAAVEGQGRYRIHAPLVHWTKAEIIKHGLALGVDYALTHSCYDPAPDEAACGHCDSCLLRREGFAAAGVADPTRYR